MLKGSGRKYRGREYRGSGKRRKGETKRGGGVRVITKDNDDPS